MRVAIISNSVTPYRIHLHQRIARECPELEIRSVFTHEFSNAPWRLDVPAEIRPVFLGGGDESEKQGFATRPLREIGKARTIARLLKEQRTDAVVLFGYNDWCRVYLMVWCRLRGIPCFVFGDSNVLAENGRGLKMLLKRAMLPAVLRLNSGAMYCGRAGAEYFRRYGVAEERLFPFPYEPNYAMVESAQQAGEDLGLRAGRRRLLYAGRLARVKRVDLLIAAFQAIAEERPEWDLAIAGDGPEREELTKEGGPAGRVQFLGFINEPERLARLYAACDVLVLPSEFEPWGVVVTEAANHLALVCSSQVGAGRDLIVEHGNGRIFRSGDAGALRDALLEVTDAGNIDRMKAASRAVLSEWRAKTDPVQGLRSALRFAGIEIPTVYSQQPAEKAVTR